MLTHLLLSLVALGSPGYLPGLEDRWVREGSQQLLEVERETERQKDKRKLVAGKGASNERLQCGRQLGQRRLSSPRKANGNSLL